MATGIGIGIAGDVFQEKAGAGIGPDPFLDMYSVQFDGVDEYLIQLPGIRTVPTLTQKILQD